MRFGPAPRITIDSRSPRCSSCLGARPARVVVRRARWELRRAGVNGPERALAGERRLRVQGEGTQLAQEPGVDRRQLVNRLDADPASQQLQHRLEAIGPGDTNAL